MLKSRKKKGGAEREKVLAANARVCITMVSVLLRRFTTSYARWKAARQTSSMHAS